MTALGPTPVSLHPNYYSWRDRYLGAEPFTTIDRFMALVSFQWPRKTNENLSPPLPTPSSPSASIISSQILTTKALSCSSYIMNIGITERQFLYTPPDRLSTSKQNGKAIPLQAWTGPEGSRRLRLPDFKTIGA